MVRRHPVLWLAAFLTMQLVSCEHALAEVQLLELHGPDHQRVYVNEISSLREPTSSDLRRYFTTGSRCVVVTTNGKFIAVVETCPFIRDRMAGR